MTKQTISTRIRKYSAPILATFIYLLLALLWLYSFGLLALSIAPEEQPMTYISMLCYAVVVLPALIFSFVFAARDRSKTAVWAALVPVVPLIWAIISWILLFKSYA